jgi:hypothetical protein
MHKRKLKQEITAVLRATNGTVYESTDVYKNSLCNHRGMCHILENHQQYYGIQKLAQQGL